MTLQTLLFYLLAAVVVGSALGVVLSTRIVRAAVWLLFTLLAVAMLYFLLGAEFLGAAQLIVYVGGTLVLLIFGIMLTAERPFPFLRTHPLEWLVGGALGVILLALLVNAFLGYRPPPPPQTPMPATTALGLGFLGLTSSGQPAYLFPFEIVSVHLLVVLVAAAYLARAKRKQKEVTGG